ncbi:somatostatin receptor type 2-like [Glandiceps talaboti]
MPSREVTTVSASYSIVDNVNFTIDIPDDNWFRSTIIPITFGIICCFGVIGNSIVIFVLGCGPGKRPTIPNIFFFNLAIADILFLATLPFYAYQYARRKWAFGYLACKIFIGFDGMNQFTSIFLLTAMSIDRYLAIVYPIRCKAYRTVYSVRIITGCVWILSVVCSLPLWMYATVYPYSNVSEVCIIDWPGSTSSAGPVAFFIFAFISGFVLPLVCIFICYLNIFNLILLRRRFRLKNCPKIRTNTRRIASLVIAVVLAFIICWLPFYIVNFISMTMARLAASYSFNLMSFASICLTYINSCLNPIIYSFMGADFLKKLRGSKRKRKFITTGERRSTSIIGPSSDIGFSYV